MGRTPRNASPEERFWGRVDRESTAILSPHVDTPCWIWRGRPSRPVGGYGIAIHEGRRVVAHRLSWEMTHGARPPANMEVCHRCDVSMCVRPDHLFLADHAGNMADMVAKGRSNRGDRNPLRRDPSLAARGEEAGRAKLTNADADTIRRSFGTVPNAVLAERFGVSPSTVSRIGHQRTWRAVAGQ